MDTLRLLFIGDRNRAEFRQAVADLEAWGHVDSFAGAEWAAVALAAGETTADLIVLAQAYPGQFSAAEVDRLRQAAPLARLVVLLGVWCEGEMRTGRPHPAVIRIYGHQWPARCRQELDRLRDGGGSTWALPVTATEEERLLAIADSPLPVGQGLVAIFTHRPQMGAWLADACRSCGYATAALRPPHAARVQGATAVIYDGHDFAGELRPLARGLAPARVIALLDFPRSEDRARAAACGAAAVLAKPLHVDDLAWELGQIQ
jgi:CheY-like chemotaxis protein